MNKLARHKLSGQAGFSLITAIFLLVVVATLMSYMVNLSVVQHTTMAMSVQGARALQAARAGIEYGAYQALLDPVSGPAWCAATPDSLSFDAVAEPALSAFNVTLNCTSSNHAEGATVVTFFDISALAESGTYAQGANANPDYISRRIRITVSAEPP
ncbi:MAG: pilus assembly protein MshP [Gammaproteobacteria bacterium]|nr:pilus assembly protein MshP [Gammaproteobacteria bacterium]